MQDHLSGDAIERLVSRRCHASRAYGWLLHLLSCAECRGRVAHTYPGKGERFLREIFRTQEPLHPPDLTDGNRLDRVLDNLQTHGLLEYVQDGDVPPLLAELDRHPPERQRLILDNTERLWNLTTIEFLFERCESEYHRDPHQGQKLAEHALSVLDRLSPNHYHPSLLNDLRGRAWGLRGNFLKVREQLAGAKQDLKRSAASLEAGTGDADEKIRFLRFRGSLATALYKCPQAIASHKKALELSRAIGDRQSEFYAVAALMLNWSSIGNTVEAIQLGEEYMGRVSLEQDGPLTVLFLMGNLVRALSLGGRGLPAYRLHQEMLSLIPASRPRLVTRVRWGQLHIFESLGDFEAADQVAEAILNEVVEDLEPISFASLWADRARLALRRGDKSSARKYGSQACPILERKGWDSLSQGVQQMLAGGPLVWF